MNNLKVENFVLFGGIFEDLSLSDRSEGLLQRDKGGARIYSSFATKTQVVGTSQDFLLLFSP